MIEDTGCAAFAAHIGFSEHHRQAAAVFDCKVSLVKGETMKEFEEKKRQLTEAILRDTKENVCLALSGGVDSSLLAAVIGQACRENGTKAYGATFETVLHPAADVEAARTAARESGLIHQVIHVDELELEEIQNNPKNRCYLCKKQLFEHLLDFAGAHHAPVVYEGTNYDDLSQYRPGLKAVKELGVRSPLLEFGFTKAEIRRWASEYGIQAAQRPSSPCMATRLPYGTKLDLPTLRRIEAAEEAIKVLGYPVVRVRLHGDVVRLEFPKEELSRVLEQSTLIINLLKSLDFHYITLDMEGFRSGSMDI